MADQPIKPVPYRGLVRATEDCATEHYHKAGEVFAIDLPCLWSDDPFVPVVQTGVRMNADGVEVPIYEVDPAAPKPNNFRLRPKASYGNEPEPQRPGAF